jgi:hypothetical protein
MRLARRTAGSVVRPDHDVRASFRRSRRNVSTAWTVRLASAMTTSEPNKDGVSRSNTASAPLKLPFFFKKATTTSSMASVTVVVVERPVTRHAP